MTKASLDSLSALKRVHLFLFYKLFAVRKKIWHSCYWHFPWPIKGPIIGRKLLINLPAGSACSTKRTVQVNLDRLKCDALETLTYLALLTSQQSAGDSHFYHEVCDVSFAWLIITCLHIYIFATQSSELWTFKLHWQLWGICCYGCSRCQEKPMTHAVDDSRLIQMCHQNYGLC